MVWSLEIYDTGTTYNTRQFAHKFWNAGAHNFNDFNFSAFSDVLDALKKKFNIEPRTMYFKVFRGRN
jgi:hypothetical protein